MNDEFMEIVREEMFRAKSLHPDFPSDPVEQIPIILEEFGEVAKEINISREMPEHKSIENYVWELSHVVVTVMRAAQAILNQRRGENHD